MWAIKRTESCKTWEKKKNILGGKYTLHSGLNNKFISLQATPRLWSRPPCVSWSWSSYQGCSSSRHFMASILVKGKRESIGQQYSWKWHEREIDYLSSHYTGLPWSQFNKKIASIVCSCQTVTATIQVVISEKRAREGWMPRFCYQSLHRLQVEYTVSHEGKRHGLWIWQLCR